MIFRSGWCVVRAESLSIVWCPLGSCVLCQTVFVISTCVSCCLLCTESWCSVPTWELGVVLDRGHDEMLVCVGQLFFVS